MFAWIINCAGPPAIISNIITALAVFNYETYQPKAWHTTLIMWGLILVPFVFNLWFRQYTGRYWNSIQNFFIDIAEKDGKLYVSFQGRDADTFELFPYQEDSFYWKLTYDEAVKLARYPNYWKDYYILSFDSDCHAAIGNSAHEGEKFTCLRWKHDETMQGDGEVFVKTEEALAKQEL